MFQLVMYSSFQPTNKFQINLMDPLCLKLIVLYIFSNLRLLSISLGSQETNNNNLANNDKNSIERSFFERF